MISVRKQDILYTKLTEILHRFRILMLASLKVLQNVDYVALHRSCCVVATIYFVDYDILQTIFLNAKYMLAGFISAILLHSFIFQTFSAMFTEVRALLHRYLGNFIQNSMPYSILFHIVLFLKVFYNVKGYIVI